MPRTTTSSTSEATTTSPASSADAELVQRVARRLGDLRERIASCGREPDEVRVVGVTKTFGPEMVRAAAAAGITTVGENYVDELEAKRAAVGDLGLRWHFLGALQTNKIARAARAADVLCAVARAVELERLARVRPGATLYVEVDFTGLASRHGAAPGEVADLVARARDLGLDVAGLMTVAAPDPALAREAFAGTARLADRLGVLERSMGMSDDLELALAEGSTEIRVGRGLFGARSAPTALA